MASRSPIVYVAGQTEQLQSADATKCNQPASDVDAVDRQTFYTTFANPNDPYVYTYENLALYASGGSPQAANEVDYMRVWIPTGRTITKMRLFITSGANGVRQIQLGIYDQATPTSITGTPNNRVATTGSDTPPNATTGFYSVNLTSTYTTTTSGFYWLAAQSDNGTMAFAVSSVFRAGFANRREETPGSFGLPATAGATTQPQSAIWFVAAVE